MTLPDELDAITQRRVNMIGKDWFSYFPDLFMSPLFNRISNTLRSEYSKFTIYPALEDIFNCFKLCPIDKLKVIIIGQDPYYNGLANGLAFGYKDGMLHRQTRSSLNIIFEEIEQDIKFGLYLDQDASLEYLAKQGVLLINPVLTVRRNSPKSHSKIGWQNVTGEILNELLTHTNPLSIMIWGNEAKYFFNSNSSNYVIGKHLLLHAPHPASDIYNESLFTKSEDFPNTFRGCRHFSKTNEFLIKNNLEPINW